MQIYLTLLFFCAALLTACVDRSAGGTAASTAKPGQLRSIDNNSLSVSIQIDGEGPFHEGEFRSDGRWYVELPISLDVTHSYLAIWYAQVDGSSIVVLEDRGDFYANSNTMFAQAPEDAERVFSGLPQFDSDCDGTSNLDELNAFSDPLTQPGCSPGSDENPGVETEQSPTVDDSVNSVEGLAFPTPEMVALPQGCFMMGAPEDDPYRKEDQLFHEVCVQAFDIGKFEVTFEEYNAFAGRPGVTQSIPWDKNWGMERRPVLNVSWNDAVAYSEWLSLQTGDQYRLPTEAEWEYAARAGTQTPFWTGDMIRDDEEHFNSSDPYGGGIATGQPDRDKTRPVGSLKPNPFGLFDMLGNVIELTCSAYVATYDGTENTCNDDPDMEKQHRGAAYNRIASWARVAHRTGTIKTHSISGDLGFRVVRERR